MDNGTGKCEEIHEKSIPVIKEVVKVGKQRVDTEEVTIRKNVSTRHETVNLDLNSESVRVERVEKNKEVDEVPHTRQEGDTMVIPVVKEILVTKKQLVLVEEVRITKVREHNKQLIQEELREESILIDRKAI